MTHRPGYRIARAGRRVGRRSRSWAGGSKTPLLAFLDRALPPLVEGRPGGLTEALSSGSPPWRSSWGSAWHICYSSENRNTRESLAQAGFLRRLHAFWFADWGFDWLYDRTLVRPFLWIATVNRRDVVDNAFTAIARLNQAAHHALSRTETGRLRWYAAAIGAGAVDLCREWSCSDDSRLAHHHSSCGWHSGCGWRRAGAPRWHGGFLSRRRCSISR